MVVAMGTASLNRLEWSEVSPEFHYIRAVSKLEEVSTMKSLAPLQTVLLLCQYGIFCSMRDTSASMWHLVGLAARLCLEIGLHRKPGSNDATMHGSTDAEMKLELEMRTRCFWCVYNLDRIVSVTLGRPVALRDEDIDVPLPSVLGHEEGTIDGAQQSDLISPFLHMIAIRKLAGKILQTVNCSVQNRDLPHEQKFALRRNLHEELDIWKAEISRVNLRSPKPGEQFSSSFLWPTWYEIPYHNALLLLYRPSPLFPSSRPSTNERTAEWRAALDQIYTSSKAVIHLYADLHRTQRLNYSWITLNAVFMAGLAYVYCISLIMKEYFRAGGELPACLDYICIIADTRVCSNVLVAINERWAAARESCDIFERLSMAIVQDAVKARLRIDAAHQATAAAQYYHSNGTAELAYPGNRDHAVTPDSNIRQPPQPFLANTSHVEGSNMQNIELPENSELLTVASFRKLYQDLQNGHSGSIHYDHEMVPSEVFTGFSQDWFEADIMDGLSGSNDFMTDQWQTMRMYDQP